MIYIVQRLLQSSVQVSIDDILDDIFNQTIKQRRITNGATLTRCVERLPDALATSTNVDHLIYVLKDLNKRYEKLFGVERKTMYREFYIPKKTGGLRKIDAPNDELMAALRELKVLLENEFGMMYHTSAYAYVPGRSTVDAVKRHQANESRWFLKTDFSGFFPSTTLEFTMKMLSMVYPFSEVVKVPEGKENLERALSLGFLDGGLPQGTPLSPSLTNAIMIPIDHTLARFFSEKQMVYTRYADDIHVSSKYDFKYTEIVAYINNVVRKEFGAPYMIKPEKTHYGSSAGRNFLLGCMLNANNDITIGHAKKKQFKAMLNNYICDFKNGIRWDLNDVQTFNGLISYYLMVERDYISHVISEYNKKYGVNLKLMLKDDIGGRHSVG